MIERKQRVKQLRRLGIKSTQKNPRGKLIDISSILKGESTLKFPRRINVISSTWIRLSKSMKSRRIFHVEVRCRINGESTKMCPLGFGKSKTLSDIKRPCNLPDLTVVLLLLKLVLFSATLILLVSLPPAISTIDRTIDRLIYSKNPGKSLDDCKRVQTSVDESQKNVDERRRVTRRVQTNHQTSVDECRRVTNGPILSLLKLFNSRSHRCANFRFCSFICDYSSSQWSHSSHQQNPFIYCFTYRT